MKASFLPTAVSLFLGITAIARGQTAQPSRSALLQFDFNDVSAWAQKPTLGVGTIDVAGSKEGSGAVVLSVAEGVQKPSALASGPLPVRNTETNLGKLTLSFDLSVSTTRPVKVRIESLDTHKRPTGTLEGMIYPAAPDFYQRYAVDLSTLKPAGAGRFDPAGPFVNIALEIDPAAGWDASVKNELRLDNVNYSTPAYYVSPTGSDAGDGRTEQTAFATPQAALDVARAGDIILLRKGVYHSKDKVTALFKGPGTPAAWIVLKNYPGETPTLTGNAWNIVSMGYGSKVAADTDHTLAYLEVRGLHVRGESDLVPQKFPESIGKSDPHSNTNGIAVDGRSMAHVPHHLRFADCLVEFCPGLGIGSIDGDWITVENNVCRSNSWHTVYATSGFSVMGKKNFDATVNVYRNLVRNNTANRNETFQQWGAVKRISDGNGIILDVNQTRPGDKDTNAGNFTGRTLVTGNLCFDNGGSGIHCVSADRVDIINNTAYLNSASKALQYSQIYTYGSKDCRIMNNILVAPVADVSKGEKPEPVNRLGGKNKDVVFANNLYFGGNIPPFMGEGDMIADPRFVNPTRDGSVADFHLRAGSPALRIGKRLPIVPIIDSDGKVLGPNDPINLGAYQTERAGGPTTGPGETKPEKPMNQQVTTTSEFHVVLPKAKSVDVKGNWSDTVVKLAKDESGGTMWVGDWNGLAPALPAGAYEYSYLLDGATQPADPAVGHILHVPAADATQYPAQVAHGAVTAHRYASKALGIDRECWIYTPPGYETGDKRYPLLVLQHAGADTQKTWVTKGNVDWLLDELIGAHKAVPMVVLMLDGHPKGEGVYIRPGTRVAAMNDLKNELFDDAIPLVEAKYRVESSRELRGLAGPSVGGGQMISIGLTNLDRFAWIGIFSGGHGLPEWYEPVLNDAAKVNAQLKLFWISCAKDDTEFQNNVALDAMLTAKGIRHEFYPTDGAHSWPVWRRDMTLYIERIFQPASANGNGKK